MSSSDVDAATTDALSHLKGAEDALEESSLSSSNALRSMVGMVRLFVEMESQGDLEEIREMIQELNNL